MTPLAEMKLCLLDLETTGLDEQQHEIIEFGVIIYDPVTDTILKEWEKKVAPQHIETAQEAALKINGYANNPALYTGKLKPALIKINSLAKDCMIVGQNIEFDLRFLRKNMADHDIKPSFTHRNKIDLLALAWPVMLKTDKTRLGLADLCDHFGIPNIGLHTALPDCRRGLEVYKCLMKIYNQID